MIMLLIIIFISFSKQDKVIEGTGDAFNGC